MRLPLLGGEPEVPTAALALPAQRVVRHWPAAGTTWTGRVRWKPIIDWRALGYAIDRLGISGVVEIGWEDPAWVNTHGGGYYWHDDTGHHIRLCLRDDAGELYSCRWLSRTLWHELRHAEQRERIGSRMTDTDAYNRDYAPNFHAREIEARLTEEFDYDRRLVVLGRRKQ